MNNLTKAKIIIELLDDRKYLVLSALNTSEMAKLDKY